MTTQDELAPCPVPWCNEAEQLSFIVSYWSGRACVECLSCKARGPFKPTKAEAIAAWNSRPPTDRASIRAEAFEEAVRVVERRAEERFAEYGVRDWDTNVTYYEGANAGIYESFDEEDEAIAAALRNLKTETPDAD